jgi:hypothetical protein
MKTKLLMVYPHGMTKEQLLRKQRQFLRPFYFAPITSPAPPGESSPSPGLRDRFGEQGANSSTTLALLWYNMDIVGLSARTRGFDAERSTPGID